jgi:hypothetical protein
MVTANGEDIFTVGGLVVGSVSGQTRLTAAYTSDNSINYVLPESKPTVATYSITKADYEGQYLGITLNNFQYSGFGCRSTYIFPNLQQSYSTCVERSASANGAAQFRADLGLTSLGTLPASGLDLFSKPIQSGGDTVLVSQIDPGVYGGLYFAPVVGPSTVPPPPASANAAGLTAEGQPIPFDLTVGSTGNPLQATTLGTPVGGTVATLTPTSVTYTPTKGFTGIGSFTFVVQNYQGTSTQAQAFVAIGVPRPSRPTLSTLSTTSGSTAGGQPVTISGTNLAGPAAIRFGLNPATIQSQTATSLTVAAPASTAGTVDVTISTAGGTSATSAADRYTFK